MADLEHPMDLYVSHLPLTCEWCKAHPRPLDNPTDPVSVLRRVVKGATPYGEDDDGFTTHYLLPVGPIHAAIPLLQRYGFIVQPGRDFTAEEMVQG